MIISEAENITSFTKMGALRPKSSLRISNMLLYTTPFLYLKVVLPSAIFELGSKGITSSGDVNSAMNVVMSSLILLERPSLSAVSFCFALSNSDVASLYCSPIIFAKVDSVEILRGIS